MANAFGLLRGAGDVRRGGFIFGTYGRNPRYGLDRWQDIRGALNESISSCATGAQGSGHRHRPPIDIAAASQLAAANQ